MSRRSRRSGTVRTNEAYKLDSKWEGFALLFRGIGGLCRAYWRFRTEVNIFLFGLIGYFLVRHVIGPRFATFVMLGFGSIVAAVPWSRQLLHGRLLCSMSRRRVLACLEEIGLATSKGKLPVVWRSRRTSIGERLTVRARVGHSAESIEDKADVLRAACNVREVRVTRDLKHAGVITIDVVRHDPLATVEAITSPLLDLLKAAGRAVTVPFGVTPDSVYATDESEGE